MKPTRKHIRWRTWDYGANGGYFVTICTKDRIPYFGTIRPDLHDSVEPGHALALQDISTYLIATDAAHIAFQAWQEIPVHFPFIHLDEVVIMPNHLHGILFIDKSDKTDWQPNRFGPQKNNLGVVLGSFKSAVTRQVRQRDRVCPVPTFAWQGRYNDRVLRNEAEYRIRLQYMWNNPYHWKEDDHYPPS